MSWIGNIFVNWIALFIGGILFSFNGLFCLIGMAAFIPDTYTSFGLFPDSAKSQTVSFN